MIRRDKKPAAGWKWGRMAWGAALGAGLVLASCKRAAPTMEITETRELSKFAPPANVGLSTPEHHLARVKARVKAASEL